MCGWSFLQDIGEPLPGLPEHVLGIKANDSGFEHSGQPSRPRSLPFPGGQERLDLFP